MVCSYAAYSDIGGREVNEDSYCAESANGQYLFAVADGLGGHDCGEVASALAIETLKQSFGESDYDPQATISNANRRVLEQEKTDGNNMKTTVAAAFLTQKTVTLIHIGDTRIYAFKGADIVFQSIDHSAAQMAVNLGEIKPEEIRHHADRNMLTKVLGAREDVKCDITTLNADSLDALLLCSDGFWEYVLEEEMIALKNESADPEDWLQKMRGLLAERAPDNHDNNTAIVVKVEELL